MTEARALELSILDEAGRLRRHGQPRIAKCLAVKLLTECHAIANCELADGRSAEIVTELTFGDLPPLDWYIGKLPSETKVFSADGARQ